MKLTCPESKFIVILEVTYSTDCTDQSNGTSAYAPSRCVGYYRERISSQCNGQEQCLVDNSGTQRPSFLNGKQANCAFKGQSVNIEYSCVPGKSKTATNERIELFSLDFYAKELPSIDICSTSKLDDIKEGFIHSPNYPKGYPNNLTCAKSIPTPETKHR